MSREGTTVDGECHKRTASHIRTKHKYDPDIPICDFYEVNMSQKNSISYQNKT